VKRISRSEGAEVIVVSGFKRSELPSLYRRAKVVVDWCMRGTDRMPIEASLNGALLLTSECQSATDRRDFPLPSFALTSRSTLDTRLRGLLANYGLYWDAYAPLRTLYRNISLSTMVSEAQLFLSILT
jgi:hypothetical protein